MVSLNAFEIVFHKKMTPYLIAHNLGKCWLIFKKFSPLDSAVIV